MENLKPKFLKLNRLEQKATLETVLFSSDEPLSIDKLFEELIYSIFADKIVDNQIKSTDGVLNGTEENQTNLDSEIAESLKDAKDLLVELIDEINHELDSTGRPYRIIKIAGGYQFATRKEYGELLQQVYKSKIRKRLSQAALESLAIIAYKQPISKPEIEKIRGVNSNEMVNSLIEKGFVQIHGRSEETGKALLYSTTKEFLRTFGINSLEDLPKLREIEEIAASISESDSENDVIINLTEDDDDMTKINTIDIEKMN